MKKGFTLVELSIVLVIIGLLIGGILVGQSLIESANMNKFIRQMSQFDIAVQTFHSKYNKIPGDSQLVYTPSPNICNGDNDGIINPSHNCVRDKWQYTGSYSDSEVRIFWHDLVKLAGLKLESCPDLKDKNLSDGGALPVLSGSDCNWASASLGENVTIFATGKLDSHNAIISASTSSSNMFNMLDCTLSTDIHTTDCVAPYTHVQALAFDTKIDDGASNTGQVLAATGFYLGARPSNLVPEYDVSSSVKVQIAKRFENGL